MPRYSPIKLENNLRERMLEEFVRTIASMESAEDFRNLFLDLFTQTEITMFVRRLHVGHLLLSGESYKDIKYRLKMSEDTIKSVANRISKGGKGMSKASTLLEKIIPEISDEVSTAIKSLQPHSLENLKARYASYYLADNILKASPRWIRENKAQLKRKKSLK